MYNMYTQYIMAEFALAKIKRKMHFWISQTISTTFSDYGLPTIQNPIHSAIHHTLSKRSLNWKVNLMYTSIGNTRRVNQDLVFSPDVYEGCSLIHSFCFPVKLHDKTQRPKNICAFLNSTVHCRLIAVLYSAIVALHYIIRQVLYLETSSCPSFPLGARIFLAFNWIIWKFSLIMTCIRRAYWVLRRRTAP